MTQSTTDAGHGATSHPNRTHLGGLGLLAALLLAFLATVFAPAAPEARGEDWPTYMHDNARAGVTAEQAKPTLSEAWVYRAPTAPKPAWPIPQPGWTELPKSRFDDALYAVADSKNVYFGSSIDQQVYALDAQTGRVRWKFFTSGPVRLAPSLSDGKLYFGSDDGQVYCLRCEDGSLVWSFNAAPAATRVLGNGRVTSLWPVRTSVMVADGRVYFGAGVFPYHKVYVFALDAATGKLAWKADDATSFGGFSPQGYLLSAGKALVVPAGRAAPTFLQRADGKPLDLGPPAKLPKGEATGDYGIVTGNTVWVGTQNSLYGKSVDGSGNGGWRDTLKLLATPTHFLTLCGPPPPAYGRKSTSTENNFITCIDRKAYQALPRKDAESVAKIKRWRLTQPGLTSMIAAGEVLIAGADDKVTMVNIADGKQAWSSKVDGAAVGLAYANGRLLVSTTKGTIHCFAEGSFPPAAPPVATAANDPSIEMLEASAIVSTALEATSVRRGYALVVGHKMERAAIELARSSELVITYVELDAKNLAAARARVDATGLYGHRVAVEAGTRDALPFPDFAANLVLSADKPDSPPGGSPRELLRALKPCGGVLLDARPPKAGEELDAWKAAGTFKRDPTSNPGGRYAILVRGELPGSGWWTHQYADAGNSGSSGDKAVKGRLGVLWFGEPGADEAPDRHQRGSAPLVVNGRVFTQGWQFLGKVTSVICFDAYNGLRYWETPVPNALRLNLPGLTSNLAANADSLFVAAGGTCHQLDAATGEIKRKFEVPPPETPEAPEGPKGGKPEGGKAKSDVAWGYVSVVDGMLLGSASTEARAAFSDSVFAYDIATGKLRWQHAGREIRNTTIAYGGARIYFAQNLHGEATYLPPPGFVPKKKPKPAVAAKPTADQDHDQDGPDDDDTEVDRLGKPVKAAPMVMRTVTALDAATGKPIWEREADMTHCGTWGAGTFGTMQALCKDDVLLFAAANTPYGGGPKPEKGPQCGLALSAKTGSTIWALELGNRSRPVFMQDVLLVEPHFIDIASGKQLMRGPEGKEKPWVTGGRGGCGSISASDSMIFSRNGVTTWSNVNGPGGGGQLVGVRPGCMINIIPAGGVVVQAEASSGCACYQTVQCTVVLRPLPSAGP